MSATDLLRRYALAGLCLALILPLVVAPLLVIAVQSVLVSGSQGWSLTLDAFLRVLGTSIYWVALLNTLTISLGATVIASGFGVPLGWLFARSNVAGGALLEHLAQLPIFIPPFVGAIAWILLGAPRIGLLNAALRTMDLPQILDVYTHSGMAWVIGLYLAPYVMMIVAGALRSMDPSLEEAGRVAGLGSFKTAWRITLPLVAPAILSGAVLAFSIAIGLFGTPVVLGWSRQILLLTSRIWVASQAVPSDYGVMAVLALYLMALSSIAMAVQRRLLGGRSFTTVSGKGFRARVVALGRWRWPLTGLALLYVLLTVIAPIAILAVAAASTYTWSGKYTTTNFRELASPEVWFTLLQQHLDLDRLRDARDGSGHRDRLAGARTKLVGRQRPRIHRAASRLRAGNRLRRRRDVPVAAHAARRLRHGLDHHLRFRRPLHGLCRALDFLKSGPGPSRTGGERPRRRLWLAAHVRPHHAAAHTRPASWPDGCCCSASS